jgi:hypothetical protein
MIFALLVGAPRPLTPPPRGPAVDDFCIDGGRSRTSGTASQEARPRRFLVDGGHSRTFGTASTGSAVDVFYAHGGRL